MKKITSFSLLLLLAATAFAVQSTQPDNSFETFWQAFKGAVVKRDVATVARMSRFPIEMSYGIPSVKTKAQLSKRYRQVFNEQTNAAACFAKAKPEADAENPKHFSIACPDAAGNEVVVYHFQQTRTGWKFTGLDNLNE
ncbi:MAG TPA: hypothetical protein VFR78_13345 [Pyrinomonadaceae bacterium]|nr:hypothetical protein [Pyrinomonadaceae bacterium]